MSLRNCPNYFPGESSDLQPHVLAQHSRKSNRQQPPKAVLPPGRSWAGREGSCLPQLHCRWLEPSLENERFPRGKKGVWNQGHCCQVDSRHCFLPGVYLTERTESSVERSGKATCPCGGHWSASPAATGVQFPAEEKDSTSEAITGLAQRKKYLLPIKEMKTFPETPSSQNQPTAVSAAIVTHGQGFVSLMVLGRNSQATAVSFLKSHQSL